MYARVRDGAHRSRDTGKLRTRRSGDESGNIIVLFAIFLPIFILCCAIAIDVGYWWVNGKKAQIAADACALAAARQLPQNYNRVECSFGTPVRDYVLTNLPEQADPDKGALHLSTKVISPYKGQAKYVEATVRMRVRTFFGPFVGLDWVDLTRRAVAEKFEGEGNLAIYSHAFLDGCDDGDGLEFDGGGTWVNGLIHSNSQYDVNSGHPPDDDFWAADGTIAKENCVANLDPEPDGAQYGDGPDFLPRDGVQRDWPFWFTKADFGWPSCSGANFAAEEIVIKTDKVELKKVLGSGIDKDVPYSGAIPPGTYCATKSFKTNGDGLHGTLTALAPEITIDGNDQNFLPHAGNVLFYTIPNTTTGGNDGSLPGGNPFCQSNPGKEMILNGNSHTWSGYIFNPCGRILVNVGGSTIGSPTLVGTILGYKVKVNGEDFTMVGEDEFTGTIALALVE